MPDRPVDSDSTVSLIRLQYMTLRREEGIGNKAAVIVKKKTKGLFVKNTRHVLNNPHREDKSKATVDFTRSQWLRRFKVHYGCQTKYELWSICATQDQIFLRWIEEEVLSWKEAAL